MHRPRGPAISAGELAIGFPSYTDMASADTNGLTALSTPADYSCSSGHNHWQLAERDHLPLREGLVQPKAGVIVAHVLSCLSADSNVPIARATALTDGRH